MTLLEIHLKVVFILPSIRFQQRYLTHPKSLCDKCWPSIFGKEFWPIMHHALVIVRSPLGDSWCVLHEVILCSWEVRSKDKSEIVKGTWKNTGVCASWMKFQPIFHYQDNKLTKISVTETACLLSSLHFLDKFRLEGDIYKYFYS